MQEKLLKKIGGILGAAFGNPFSSEELFIVIACFSIFTHLSTPPRVGPIIICLPSLSFVVVASLLKKATSLPAADRSFPVDWRKLL